MYTLHNQARVSIESGSRTTNNYGQHLFGGVYIDEKFVLGLLVVWYMLRSIQYMQHMQLRQEIE